MAMISRAAAFGFKLETTPGTANAPSASSNVIVVHAMDFNPLANATQLERNDGVYGHLSSLTLIPGMMGGAFKAKTYLSGSGVDPAGTPTAPTWYPLLIACGYQQVVTATTSVAYKPSSLYVTSAQSATATRAGAGTGTAYLWSSDISGAAAGKLYSMVGCMGNAKFTFNVGEPPTIEWDFKGVYAAPSVTSFPSFTISQDAQPLPFLSAGATFTPSGGAAHTSVIRSFEYDTGASVVYRKDANNSSGYIATLATDRKPTFKLVVEEPASYTPATGQNWWTNFSGGVTGDLEIGTVGSTAGNKYAIDMPKVGFNKVEKIEQDGIVCISIEGTPATNAVSTGDDEFVLTLT